MKFDKKSIDFYATYQYKRAEFMKDYNDEHKKFTDYLSNKETIQKAWESWLFKYCFGNIERNTEVDK